MSTLPTLLELCQTTIVHNLERYPPHSFGVCRESEFDELISLKHQKTSPLKGTGGIDGTGRVAPAVSDKFMAAIEDACPHLAESVMVDELIWKDNVEYKFRRGGLTRPPALVLPWPRLVQHAMTAADFVLRHAEIIETKHEHMQTLFHMPINVALLQSSSIGKTVKKILKLSHSRNQAWYEPLQQTLQQWKTLAAENTSDQDLAVAEQCQNWRQLFRALQHREECRRNDQGARMREIRHKLDSDRPKVVKVIRKFKPKYDKILQRPSERHASANCGAAPRVSKLSKLKQEAAICTVRQKGTPTQLQPSKAKPSFGTAVAFASGVSPCKKKTAQQTVVLAGGRQMQIPNHKTKAGAPPTRELTQRLLATKVLQQHPSRTQKFR